MLNFLLTTDKDRKEAAALERRRAREEERKKRIFNPRARLIGNDYTALIQQIEDKHKRDAEEKRIQKIYEEEQLKNDQIAIALAHKEKEERRKLEQEILNFRKNFQKLEDRREFDLNDPNYKKKLLPARLHDEDPRCGPSSAQKFEGEDLVTEERLKVQREQTRSWLSQQIEERKAAEKDRKIAEDEYNAAIISRDARAIELDQMEKQCRKRLEQACSRYNKALMEERECYRKIKEQEEKDDNLAEMYNAMTSDILTENPEVSKSNLGAGRQIGYLYKGMTPEEKEAFRVAQLAQIEEAKARRDMEKRIDREFEDFFNGTQRTISIMDQEIERKKRDEYRRLAEENQKLSVEQKNQKEYMEKIVYSNRPTAAFFDQFNKSTR